MKDNKASNRFRNFIHLNHSNKSSATLLRKYSVVFWHFCQKADHQRQQRLFGISRCSRVACERKGSLTMTGVQEIEENWAHWSFHCESDWETFRGPGHTVSILQISTRKHNAKAISVVSVSNVSSTLKKTENMFKMEEKTKSSNKTREKQFIFWLEINHQPSDESAFEGSGQVRAKILSYKCHLRSGTLGLTGFLQTKTSALQIMTVVVTMHQPNPYVSPVRFLLFRCRDSFRQNGLMSLLPFASMKDTRQVKLYYSTTAKNGNGTFWWLVRPLISLLYYWSHISQQKVFEQCVGRIPNKKYGTLQFSKGEYRTSFHF